MNLSKLWATRNTLEGNIWKYALFATANKRVFVAILSAYYMTIPDATAQTVGFIVFCGTMAGFFFEIPSGYLSDKMGHKKALVFSRILMLVSTGAFIIAESVAMMVIGSVFLSLAHAMVSGTNSAFMHETLRELGKEKQYSQIMGKLSAIGFAVPIPLMILTPFLVSVDFKVPFVVGFVMDMVGLVAAVSFVSPTVKPEKIEEINTTNFVQVVQEGKRLHYFQYALFSGIVGGVLFGMTCFRPVYQMVLEVPVIYYGVFLGIGRAMVSLILAYSGKLKEQFNIYQFCLFQIILYGTMFVVLGITGNAVAVVAIFIILNGFQWGLSEVHRGFSLEIIGKSNFKATLLSMESQIDRMITAVTSIVLGWWIAQTSYQNGFLTLAIIFVAVLLSLYFYMVRKKHF